MVVALLITPAFAADPESGDPITEPTYITVPAPDVYVSVEDNTPAVFTVINEFGRSTRSAFEEALVSIFGEYTPRTQTVIVLNADGSTAQYDQYVTGIAGLDWVWISGVSLFGMFLFCLMRLLGGAVK